MIKNTPMIDNLLMKGGRVAGVLVLALGLVGACSDDGAGDIVPAGGRRPVAVAGLGGDQREPLVTDTIDLRTIGYSQGAADAPVVVYEFSDFGCPFCSLFAKGSYPVLYEEFIATGKVRWTYVPFAMGMFPNGDGAARAAECAGEQEAFWGMHDRLYDNPNEWKGSRNPAALFSEYAQQLALDTEQFATCYREGRQDARTAVNNRAADALRVRATPSFFINGRLVEGALPLEQFQMVLRMMAGEG